MSNENACFCSRTLDIMHLPDNHTAENLSDAIYSVLNDWSITTKIVAYVSDNSKNMSNIKTYLNESLRQMQPNIGEIHHLKCLAHSINLIVKKITKFTKITTGNETQSGSQFIDMDRDDETNDFVYSDSDSGLIKNFKSLVEKCRKISALFHQSSIFPVILTEKQKAAGVKQKRLLQDVPTRWNSTFLMLDRYSEQNVMVNEVL